MGLRATEAKLFAESTEALIKAEEAERASLMGPSPKQSALHVPLLRRSDKGHPAPKRIIAFETEEF